MHTRTHTRAHTRARTHTDVHTRAHAHTHERACICMCWAGADKEGQEGEGAAEGTEEGEGGLLDEQQQHAQLMERLFGGAHGSEEGGWAGAEGGSLASLRMLGAEEEGEEAGAGDVGEQRELEKRMGLLAPEEAQALRVQLDARLQVRVCRAEGEGGRRAHVRTWRASVCVDACKPLCVCGDTCLQVRVCLTPFKKTF